MNLVNNIDFYITGLQIMYHHIMVLQSHYCHLKVETYIV